MDIILIQWLSEKNRAIMRLNVRRRDERRLNHVSPKEVVGVDVSFTHITKAHIITLISAFVQRLAWET
jgi:hypothetical protein